ncbi:hypothetical protein NXS98_06885 [Fontisphaera persica]|uniref:hypothetical protein n=1 Tax=Fontisphaera persica TaxID=2974023 RepID=UPI0024C00FE0|nr:hypothetical protein [Fontisphaera persica]WCJ60848.1 hypothetical protein NXS98_06885 [Fontisphaera persica]
MSSPIPYKPIGSVGTRGGGLDMIAPVRVRLYLGPDHLLLVEKSLMRENYRRLYFRDVQALWWAGTRTWLWHTLLLALPLLFLTVITLIAWGSGAEVFLGVLTGLLFLWILENLRRGPSCRVFLQTPAQCLELSPINRVREARRFLEQLRPLIHQHQTPSAPAPLAPPSPSSPANP